MLLCVAQKSAFCVSRASLRSRAAAASQAKGGQYRLPRHSLSLRWYVRTDTCVRAYEVRVRTDDKSTIKDAISRRKRKNVRYKRRKTLLCCDIHTSNNKRVFIVRHTHRTSKFE